MSDTSMGKLQAFVSKFGEHEWAINDGARVAIRMVQCGVQDLPDGSAAGLFTRVWKTTETKIPPTWTGFSVHMGLAYEGALTVQIYATRQELQEDLAPYASSVLLYEELYPIQVDFMQAYVRGVTAITGAATKPFGVAVVGERIDDDNLNYKEMN